MVIVFFSGGAVAIPLNTRLFSHILLLSVKSQVPDFPPVFKGFTLEKERAALFFPAHQGFYGDLPGYYLNFILKSNKVYEKSFTQRGCPII
ncbi:hypothetical protein D3H55_12680 [Bacillus salacetis]|uniref:Uncharacterized protein n=1 Tax=Bacillus salacetis TaxID=2315464 RepID=A0A3A1QWU6_9BACI|nr:hypothetical protein [Bacillus salacetis]RIW32726.1 hypothetical protein D3H55_12680 [Bacillus salacetis]